MASRTSGRRLRFLGYDKDLIWRVLASWPACLNWLVSRPRVHDHVVKCIADQVEHGTTRGKSSYGDPFDGMTL